MKRNLFRSLIPLALTATALALAAAPALAAPQLGVELSYEASEIQEVEVAGTSGQFRLRFGSGGPGASETGDLEFNASAAQVEAALNALADISSSGGSVSVTGTVKPSGRFYTVTFNGGPLRNTDVPAMSAVDGTTPLSGSVEGRPVGVSVKTTRQGGVRHSDERVGFTVKVKNTATEAPPAVGDTVRCAGAPPARSWAGNPAPTDFGYQWTRGGVPIVGATSITYTLTTDDAGEALQCVVTGANEVVVKNPPESVTAKSSVASEPLLVPPAPSPLAPLARQGGGSWRPTVSGSGETAKRICTPPIITTNTATANLSSGSTALNAVTTASGEGKVVVGTSTNEVTKVKTVRGVPFRVGQTVTLTPRVVGNPPPITPPGTEITAVDEADGTLTLSNPVTDPEFFENNGKIIKLSGEVSITAGSQPFSVGEEIFGEGIPAGDKIEAIDGQEITLEAPATITKSEAVVWSAATGTWSFQWLRNGVPIVGATGSEYTPEGADKNKNLQCEVIGRTGSGEAPDGGGLVGVSANSFTGALETASPAQKLPENATNQTPFVASAEYAAGVQVELELPAGQETYAYQVEASGWECEAHAPQQPGPVRCSREDSLAPEQKYPPLTVVTHLGADAPDIATATATASAEGLQPVSDQLSFPIEPALPFGLSRFTAPLLDEAGGEYTQAGGHPFLGESEVVVNQKVGFGPTGFGHPTQPLGQLRQLFADLPPGTIGNPSALPALCASVSAGCGRDSAVGFIKIVVQEGGITTPIYALEPSSGNPAEFFFTEVAGNVFTLTPRLRPAEGYAISLEIAPAPAVDFSEAKTTLCGYGVKEEFSSGTFACFNPGEPGANPKPFITAPTRCGVPFTTGVRLNSWEDPTLVEGPPFEGAPIEGCDKVPFEPKIKVVPTSNLADSPTGLQAELTMPTEGLEKTSGCHQRQGDETSPLAPECLSESNLRDVKVTLPKGLAVNPAGANGLEACSEAQIGISDAGAPNDEPARCPTGSRIGSVEIVTPLLKKPLDGSVYQAEQDKNPFHSTIALYVFAEDAERGVRLKLPGKVELDPQTGQLTSTFADTPQQPFKSFKLEFFGGATAPLRTPETCGTYSTESVLTPWSGGPSASETNTYSISQGPGSEEGSGGGACATSPAAMPNAPEFDAGTVTPVAASYSPFVVRLRRQDGSQRFSAIDLTTPPGFTGKLAGTPPCPEAALAAAAAKSGRAEQAEPSCPAASRVGSVHVASGAGPAPFWATGEAYLAGPYEGAPLSLAIVTPAVAGPFDLGTVVVRAALHIDPTTAQISAVSDPIPQLLDGIPLDVRTVAIAIDKPQFSLNGTNCDPLAVAGQAISPLGASAPLAERFQLGECARLGFKPKLALKLRGSTARGGNPALRAVLQARPGDADIASISVALPHSEFLAQSHIRTICTRVQFAEGAGGGEKCPAGSIYGHVRATSPLVDYALEGPVILRSSSHNLPDLVPVVRGPASQPIVIAADGRVDSVRGGIRNSFESFPDLPIGKVVLSLPAGKKSLLENAPPGLRDTICGATERATVKMSAQNGKTYDFRPALGVAGCRKQGRKAGHRRHRGAAG